MPQLEHVSIFVQGPLRYHETYEEIISMVKSTHTERASALPKLLVLRLPHPMQPVLHHYYRGRDFHETLRDPTPFQIVMPSEAPRRLLADTDVGADVGWRHGVVFLPSDEKKDGSSGFIMRSYTVWTPMSPGVSWPYKLN